MKKALIIVAVVAVAMLALAAPALAEGYNNGGVNFGNATNPAQHVETGYAQNAGLYSADPAGAQIKSVSGPHGGYTTTTNKCQDCHSTHYATGSYMLLRADSRETACDFCHVGGGGSQTNIQMDNQYNATSSIATDTMGFGTGHTLGYKGNAPASINPAFSSSAGFACFDCHTPHGNSARTMATFGAPGDIAGTGVIAGNLVSATLLQTMMYNFTGQAWNETIVGTPGQYAGTNIDDASVPSPTQPNWGAMNSFMADVGAYKAARIAAGQTTGPFPGMTWQTQGFAQAMGMLSPDPLGGAAQTEANTLAGSGQTFYSSYIVYWGIDADKGNIVTKFWNFPGVDPYTGFDLSMANMAYGLSHPGTLYAPRVEIWKKPLFPKGRFLLLANPSDMLNQGIAGDLNVAAAGVTADNGVKKMAINWAKPDGPDATWGPLSMSGQTDKFPLQFPWAADGLSMENEMCADCHDGAAGSSQQAANVWRPDPTNTTTGTYMVAYSHDSQPKACARQEIFNPQNKDNLGPHCRNCHTGAASCNQCHGPVNANDVGMSRKNWEAYWGANSPVGQFTAWDSTTAAGSIGLEGKTKYIQSAYVKADAVTNIAGKCIDGGFSYPHRTLGVNLLKDTLWGVDFDGNPLAVNGIRGANGGSAVTTSAVAAYFGKSADDYFGRSDVAYPESGNGFDTKIVGAAAENLDSVCIDCHGNATAWNPQATVDRWYFPSNFDVTMSQGPNHVTGWELLLKGLP
jgi:hypothetical protein